MNTAIVQGSLTAISRQTGKSIAETFVNATCIVIIDTSGSMDTCDSRGGRTRYTVACDELAGLQAAMPGSIAVINFSSTVQFEPGGQPAFLHGSTNLTAALQFCKVADVPGMRFVLISDGQPDNKLTALQEAAHYKNRIDVIYVGAEHDTGGREFLAHLARTSGGRIITADRAAQLQERITYLLAG